MFYIKNKLFLLFTLVTIGLNAQTSVSGNVSTAEGKPLANLTITIKNENFRATTITNEEGNYKLENVTETDGFTFEFVIENNINPLNGVSTFDYVLTARHILGITPFEKAYQYIAMDINGTGNITAFDLVQLRQLILGVTTEFSNNNAWRFVEKTQLESLNFSQANNPEYEGDLSSNFNLTAGENTVIDLIGIKIGDANGNAATN